MLVFTSTLGGYVDTTSRIATPGRGRRRKHSDEFKADAVTAASQPGVWLAARRLNAGKFVWPPGGVGTLELSKAQLDALVLGLPWMRIGEGEIIRVI
jgi:transposase